MELFDEFFEVLPKRASSECLWSVPAEEIKAKNYDLKAVNPNRKTRGRYPNASGTPLSHRGIGKGAIKRSNCPKKQGHVRLLLFTTEQCRVLLGHKTMNC